MRYKDCPWARSVDNLACGGILQVVWDRVFHETFDTLLEVSHQ